MEEQRFDDEEDVGERYQLLECPVCDEDDLVKLTTGKGGAVSISCGGCGTAVDGYTVDEVVFWWNLRSVE